MAATMTGDEACTAEAAENGGGYGPRGGLEWRQGELEEDLAAASREEGGEPGDHDEEMGSEVGGDMGASGSNA
jgi:hypothetical protein